MTHYTYAGMEGLWINAGGPRNLAPIAAAIGEAESGGNSAAVNATDNGGRQTSWGLWQISNGTHAQPVPNILDPAVNAQQAVSKWRGAGKQFTPWGTFDSGAYRAFLSGSTTPDLTVPGAGQGGAAPVSTTATSATCLVAMPSVSLPVVGKVAGGACIFSKSEARAFIGTGILVAGVGIGMLGAILLAAYGLKSTGAGKVAGRALEVAGAATSVVAPEVGAPVAVAGSKVRAAGASSGSSGAVARRRKARAQRAATRTPAATTAPRKTKASQAQAGP